MFSKLVPTERGIYYMLIASFLFALTMLFAKILSRSMGSIEITFWRNFIGFIIIASSVYKRPLINKGGKKYTLFFRGFIGTIALLTFFYTVSQTSLSNAIVYAKTEPIFTAILAYFILHESMSKRSVFALLIGFSGMVFMSEAHFSGLHIMGFLTGFLSAWAYTSVRSLKTYYDPRTVVLSFLIFGMIIPFLLIGVHTYTNFILPAPFSETFVIPKNLDYLWILLLGISAAYGQIYMTKAYFHTPANIVSTVSYSVVLFATLFGLAIGDNFPSLYVCIGGILIISSGILLASSKKK